MANIFNRTSRGGFTLVELLVSITLGLTILLATTKLFIESRESFRYQQQWLDLHERGRHLIQFLSMEFKKIGYPAESFSGTALTATDNSEEGNSDALTISYHGAKDCAGSSATSIRYYIENGDFRCDGNGPSSPTPQTLTSHIDGLQFRFGADTDQDGSIDRYLSADAVPDWDRVHTIQTALLLRSQLPVRESIDSKNYNLLGSSHGPFNDRYLRTIYLTTTHLRNH